MAAESEHPPLGVRMPPVPAGTEIPPEPPEVTERTLYVAGRLLAGAVTFFFLAFVFAYFYLRSLDVEGKWRPHHVKPDQTWGAIFIVALILSVALTIIGGRQMKAGSRGWLGTAGAGLLLGLLAIAAQCIEFTVQKFGPTDGAYASVFCGWLGFYLLLMVPTMYWLETQIASELRARREPATTTMESDVAEVDRLIAPGLDACVFFWAYLGAIGLLTYVVLYLL